MEHTGDIPEHRPLESSWLEQLLVRHRLPVNVVIHAVLFALALFMAYLVRFPATGSPQEGWFKDFLILLPFFVALKLFVFARKKLFRAHWRYASTRDIFSILYASWWSLFFLFMAVLFLRDAPRVLAEAERLPEAFKHTPFSQIILYFTHLSGGVIFLDFLASVFLVCSARLGFRLYHEELRPVSAEGLQRVLLIGAGHAAEAVLREINRMPEERYRVVGMVDDDPSRQHLVIHGVPVLGVTNDIPRLCEEHEVDEIIISIPSATQKELRRIIDLCSGTNLEFQSLPSVGDLIDGRVTVSQIRPVDIEDLLGRESVKLDNAAIGRFVQNRRVLVTGAGGSIGSEMCRQMARFAPSQMILVEQAETPLFDIENELKKLECNVDVTACVCDISDRDRVMRVWEQFRPEVVIHAAAHKHVPMMERNSCEAIKNNVLGTKNVADASCQTGVAEFVMISTDKAVNPSSVMGATKRIAEIYTQALNGQEGCVTQFKAVRFGNVLGSAGSVIPTFRRQIAAGGPVTVTHPEMTRYFMTIPEAAQLVLQAAATGAGGQIFLLDMGDPVKIVDLARQMITLSGFRPGEDIDIVFTGVRPGEKLFEELRSEGEDIQPTVHPKVNIWNSRPLTWDFACNAVDTLDALKDSLDRSLIVRTLIDIIPEYEPLNPPEDLKAPEPSDNN
jgi:FlaA1/EpsC-like NDP-sugar epimerase